MNIAIFDSATAGSGKKKLQIVFPFLSPVRQDSDSINDLRAYLDLEEEKPSGEAVDCSAWTDIEIEFDHVSYRYCGAEAETLRDVSFRLAAGEKIALVGVNGAGKTTIVKLMAGLYLPTSGTVYVNGVSTRDLDRKSYFVSAGQITATITPAAIWPPCFPLPFHSLPAALPPIPKGRGRGKDRKGMGN